MKNLRLPKVNEFADDNLIFDENGGNSSKWVENTGGKGEIACYEQFLLFHCVFKRYVLLACKNKGLFEKGLTLSQTSPGFYVSAVQVF